MLHQNYVWCAVVVVLSAVCCQARPNQNEMLAKSSQEPAKLPMLERSGELPIQVFYEEPAIVQQVDEDQFREGRQLEMELRRSPVRRQIQRYERLVKPENQPFTIWSSLTNIVEYDVNTQTDARFKRSTNKKMEADKTFPIRKLKRDDLHIVRIKVRKGGVAIAGPGGIASAGNGGTAIVGPGGSAYTEADGTAIVGPGAKLYQLPDSKTKGRTGYKLIATGPYVFQPKLTSPPPRAFF